MRDLTDECDSAAPREKMFDLGRPRTLDRNAKTIRDRRILLVGAGQIQVCATKVRFLALTARS